MLRTGADMPFGDFNDDQSCLDVQIPPKLTFLVLLPLIGEFMY